jgi:hypothetical protein
MVRAGSTPLQWVFMVEEAVASMVEAVVVMAVADIVSPEAYKRRAASSSWLSQFLRSITHRSQPRRLSLFFEPYGKVHAALRGRQY